MVKDASANLVDLSMAFNHFKGRTSEVFPEFEQKLLPALYKIINYTRTSADPNRFEVAKDWFDTLLVPFEMAIELKAQLVEAQQGKNKIEADIVRGHGKLLIAQTRAYIAEQDTEDAHRRLEDTQRLTLTDALTGMPNRRAFDSAMDTAIRLNGSSAPDSSGEKRYYGLIAFDIDWFKRVNDTLGHTPGGDNALKALADRLQHIVRRQPELCDFAAPAFRCGGEEFFALAEVNATDRKIAEKKLAEIRGRIMNDLEGLYVTHNDITVPLNCSSGLHVVTRKDTVISAIETADKALYADKNNLDNKYARYKASIKLLGQNPDIDKSTITDISPPRSDIAPGPELQTPS